MWGKEKIIEIFTKISDFLKKWVMVFFNPVFTIVNFISLDQAINEKFSNISWARYIHIGIFLIYLIFTTTFTIAIFFKDLSNKK